MYDVIGIGVPVTDIFVIDADTASFTLQDPDFKRSYIGLATGSKAQVKMLVRTGGSSANTCAALAKLGLRTGYFGLLGTGHYSDLLSKDLMERGVDVSRVLRLPGFEPGTSMIVSTIGGNRDRAILTDYGSGMHLDEEHFKHFMGFLIDTKWLDITSVKPQSANALHSFLKQINAMPEHPKVFFAPSGSMIGPAADIVMKIMSFVDVLTLNDAEALALTETDRLEDALRELRKTRVPSIFITRGGEGIMHLAGDQVHTVSAYPLAPSEVVNTTGAGDTVAAFFIEGLLKEMSIEDILLRAGAAGALKIANSSIGAKEGIPVESELSDYVNANKDKVTLRSFTLS